MGIDELLKEKRGEIIAIAAKHGAFNVRVFGSVARGEAIPGSDVFSLTTPANIAVPGFPWVSLVIWKTCWDAKWILQP
jgi:hypothetical protein